MSANWDAERDSVERKAVPAPRTSFSDPAQLAKAVASIVEPILITSRCQLDRVEFVSAGRGGVLQVYIDKTSSQGSVQIMGVDPLQATRAIIQTLDKYISTGIGYARSIKFAREYLGKNPGLLK